MHKLAIFLEELDIRASAQVVETFMLNPLRWTTFQITAIMYSLFLLDFILMFLWGTPNMATR
jgi:hypothetical protein